MLKTTAALLSIILTPLLASAAAPPAVIEAKADRIVHEVMKEKRIPGLVLAIVQNGRVVVAKGYGVRELGGAAPDENTVFSIGSLSKALTAIGAMRLVEQGKLALDEPASMYVKGMPPAWQAITVRQFMTHTSGIPQMNRKLPTFQAMLRAANRMPMKFKPGTDQDYNNFNYAVIGAVMESISGEPYLEFMRHTVFEPLAMQHTGRSGTVSSPDRATGYALRGNGPVAVQPEPGGDYGVPSGFLETTLADLLRLNSAMAERKFLRPRTYDDMFTPSVVAGKHYVWSFTPGWQARKAGSVTVIAKNGAVEGFSSQYHFVPERNDAVIMIWNTKGKGLDLWGAVADILNQCLGVPKPGKP